MLNDTKKKIYTDELKEADNNSVSGPANHKQSSKLIYVFVFEKGGWGVGGMNEKFIELLLVIQKHFASSGERLDALIAFKKPGVCIFQ